MIAKGFVQENPLVRTKRFAFVYLLLTLDCSSLLEGDEGCNGPSGIYAYIQYMFDCWAYPSIKSYLQRISNVLSIGERWLLSSLG